MNLDETSEYMKTGVPISRSARGNQEIATPFHYRLWESTIIGV